MTQPYQATPDTSLIGLSIYPPQASLESSSSGPAATAAQQRLEQLAGSLAAVSEQAVALRQGVAELQAWRAESVASAEATAAAAAAAAAAAGAGAADAAAVDPEERGSFTLRMRRGSAPTWASECETPGGTPRTGGGGPGGPSGGGSFADPGASFVQRIEFQVIPGF